MSLITQYTHPDITEKITKWLMDSGKVHGQSKAQEEFEAQEQDQRLRGVVFAGAKERPGQEATRE